MVQMFIPVQQQPKSRSFESRSQLPLYTRNSGTRAWLVQEYLSILAKGRREDAPRRKHCAWHHADSRCSGLACDKSNVTAVHCAVVGAFKFNQDSTLSQARDDRSDRSTCNICFRVLGWRSKTHVVQQCMFRIQKHLSRTIHVCLLRVDNEGKHGSQSGGPLAWDNLPKEISRFQGKHCNSQAGRPSTWQLR